ncbi:MAG: 3-methyl-2-oxobutanoate dehydrogenase subunit VorB [Planctomycetota bacterium]|jgi:2-oxoisovalerate ferredoxin oxidoreductase alpha subunit|nr:3-methyl-2-oxobutanoate dehydrogenase subunit VorB [Planctomycetota bacterium]
MATQLMKGNHAVVVGALYAGCDCYFGYPITPASEILQEASEKFPELGRRFVQAESEEAAANMLYGAAAAGHRAMTASSGPGISLKQEAVSYLAGAELPAVIVDIMRAGPGLGNIGPEQADYNQVVKGGGHGNYRSLVLAPASVQEMCDFTGRAFDLADKYRNPVMVLADGVLGQMVEPLRFPERAIRPKIDVSWAVAGTPETSGNFLSSIALDFDLMEKVNLRLQEKYAAMADETDWEEYRLEDAAVAVVAYGITSRIARSAVDAARAGGVRAGLLRPKTLFPFPSAPLAKLASSPAKPAFVAAEMSNGQMIDDVRLAIRCARPVLLANRMGGNVITEAEIVTAIRKAPELAER